MGFLEDIVRRFIKPPPQNSFVDDSLKRFETPSHSSPSLFDLPSRNSSSSSSASSLSSSATFWMAPAPSRWSIARYVPARLRTSISKKQIAVVVCLILALGFWTTPPPSTWKRNVVHITIEQPASNPYQVLRPIAQDAPKRHAPDPAHWLEHNSQNKHAEIAGENPYLSVPALGHKNTKPRAALISLVRNSELPGLIQSMQQLEFQWNRKYNYPWIFFNDESFTDEFKVWTYSKHKWIIVDEKRSRLPRRT
jgi:alpha 1,2-mannosyltransferase